MQTDDFVKYLNDYLSSPDITQAKLSEESEVPQSQISDWKNGRIKRMSPNAWAVEEIIRKYRKSDKVPIPKIIQDAVREVWSGNDDDADAIARVIYSLSSFIDIK